MAASGGTGDANRATSIGSEPKARGGEDATTDVIPATNVSFAEMAVTSPRNRTSPDPQPRRSRDESVRPVPHPSLRRPELSRNP
jgi:hypothetical protein